MPTEVRTVCFDTDLRIEAYRFEGIMQKFPNHFHEDYVIGFIEKGERYLLCQNQEYIIHSGHITLFNPRDTHACEQVDGKTLDYRSLNISTQIMTETMAEITGQAILPRFTANVLYGSELVPSLKELHLMILGGETDFKKEELFLFFMEQLVRDYAQATPVYARQEPSDEIKSVCEFLETHYSQTIRLDQLSALTGLSKYYLLRSFTKQKGISPYSYLEAIRVSQAKKLLERGTPPLEVALLTGFSDQSHFSNFFKKLIGLTPRQYMRIFISSIEEE